MPDKTRHISYVFLHKVIGMITICFLAIWILVSGWTVRYLLNNHAFDEVDNYVKTEECSSYAYEDASNAVFQYAQNSAQSYMDRNYGRKVTNLSLSIYDMSRQTNVYRNFTLEDPVFEDTLYYYSDGYIDKSAGTYFDYDAHTSENKKIEVRYRVDYSLPAEMNVKDGYFYGSRLYDLLYRRRYFFGFSLIAAIVLFVCNAVFLVCGAGHKEGTEEIILSPFDTIPLDLLILVGLGAIWLVYLMTEHLTIIPASTIISGNIQKLGYSISNLISTLMTWLVALIPTGYILLSLILTACARFKAGTWWTNTLICRFLKWFWEIVCMSPVVPKTAASLVLVWGILFFLITFRQSRWLIFIALVISVVVMWNAWQQKRLKDIAHALAFGDLDVEIPESGLVGEYREHAEDLHNIRNAVNIAVNREMRAEHLQTELITNVSHDIKTPLTSIINYVDLLKNSHTEEEEKTYLEALSRNSVRLKRLTEDLVEASKASTGNITVNFAPTDVQEMIEQALAEYKERFDEVQLKAVVSIHEPPISVRADGRLLWRVLSNLFSNCVKYALPTTRIYIDAGRQEKGMVYITIKNTSRDELNISPDELMERFVRGDQSRNTEGSGLGLNIAKNLTQMQNGSLNLEVDGDLFKATVLLQEYNPVPEETGN